MDSHRASAHEHMVCSPSRNPARGTSGSWRSRRSWRRWRFGRWLGAVAWSQPSLNFAETDSVRLHKTTIDSPLRIVGALLFSTSPPRCLRWESSSPGRARAAAPAPTHSHSPSCNSSRPAVLQAAAPRLFSLFPASPVECRDNHGTSVPERSRACCCSACFAACCGFLPHGRL